MPHALIGYAGSTVRAENVHETVPDSPLTVLNDYFGQEINDALAVADRLSSRCRQLSVRLDTRGPLCRRA